MEPEKRAKDPLRLVLVGLQGVGKSATGNTILGRRVFRSDISSTCLTLKSEAHEGQVCGRQVTVVDTPGLFNNVLADAMMKEELERALTLCAPGPHLFLFVIQLGRFTEEERAVMDKLKEMLGLNVNLYSMVLFTYGDRLKSKTIDQFVNEDKNLQRLIHQCGGQYHVIRNTDEENDKQIRELLEKIDYQMIQRKNRFYVRVLTKMQKWKSIIHFAAPFVLILVFSGLMAFIKSHVLVNNMETVNTNDMTGKVLEAVTGQSEKALDSAFGQSEKALESVLGKSEKALESALGQTEKALESALGQTEKAVVDPPHMETLWEKLAVLTEDKTKTIPTILVGLWAGMWILRKLLKK